MTTSQEMHSIVLSQLRQAQPKQDPRRQVVLAWLVVGLLLEAVISLPRLTLALPVGTQADSRVRRVRRFLGNPRVDVRAAYDGLIRRALASWTGQRLYLALDTTTLAGRLTISRLALVYRGRAVPLVWKTHDSKSTSVAFADLEDLLDHALTLLPTGATPVLLADRGLSSAALRSWCRSHAVHFRLRMKGDQLVYVDDGPSRELRALRMRPGMVRFFQNVRLAGDDRQPLSLALGWSRRPGAEPWYILTDEHASHTTLAEYGLRMDVEEAFRDDKAGGFRFEDSRLLDAPSVHRLLLVMAVTYLYTVSAGTLMLMAGRRDQVDPHHRRGLSYFQIGARTVRRAHYTGQLPILHLWLDPTPDPEPVCPVSITDHVFSIEWLPAARRGPPVAPGP